MKKAEDQGEGRSPANVDEDVERSGMVVWAHNL